MLFQILFFSKDRYNLSIMYFVALKRAYWLRYFTKRENVSMKSRCEEFTSSLVQPSLLRVSLLLASLLLAFWRLAFWLLAFWLLASWLPSLGI